MILADLESAITVESLIDLRRILSFEDKFDSIRRLSLRRFWPLEVFGVVFDVLLKI
jgi:hypothetical protein